VALGALQHGVARQAWAFCVCDDRNYFERVIDRIAAEARAFDRSLPELTPGSPHLVIDDTAKGPAYGVMDDTQRSFLVRVARRTGLVLDPVYTGKALFGVAAAVERGEIARGADVLFIHTGGLPGLLAQGDDLAAALDEPNARRDG
jgi:D-cysteine desulfhydrase